MKKKSVDRRHPRAEHCWPANRHSYYTTGPALRECHKNMILISFSKYKGTKYKQHSFYTTGPALRQCHTNVFFISENKQTDKE